VLLHHRGGQPATRSLLRLAQPEYRAARFAELLAVQWGRLVLAAPVRSAEVRAGALLPCEARSDSLWRPGEQGGEGVAACQPAFLERLQARLGTNAVQGLRLASGYRPERLTAVVAPPAAPAVAARAAAAVQASPEPPAQWRTGAHPLWLLPQPQVLAAAPSGGGYPWLQGRALQLLAGPERLESGWWDGHDIQRDYYVAADAEGARLWIYRERDGSPPRWFLHGYFG
jgi:protein ImuB